MRFFEIFSFRLFIRIFFSLAFFLGGVGMVFWAQGLRFDFGNNAIVSTGVVSASTLPAEAGIVIDSAVRGTTPNVLLGIPLGENRICFYKEEYRPYCADVVVDNKKVHHISSVALLPQDIVSTEWGSAADFFWDPWGRGFVQRFPGLSSAYIYDASQGFRFYEPFPSSSLFTQQGTLLLPFDFEEEIFSADPVLHNNNVFLPDESGFLFSQGNILSLRLSANSETQRLMTFKKPIETAFFLPNSESIIASTANDIVFLPLPGDEPQKLFEKDANMPLRFFAADRMLFWKHNNIIYSYRFE